MTPRIPAQLQQSEIESVSGRSLEGELDDLVESLLTRHSHYGLDARSEIRFYTAAIEVHGRIEDGWAQYIPWLERIWGGRVLEGIDQMTTFVPKEGDAPEDLTSAITYLTNGVTNSDSRIKGDSSET